MRKLKESGIEWIGDIPTSWEVKRLKNILVERKENNNPVKTDNILSLTNEKGVIPYSERGNSGNKAKDDLTGYKLAYPGDIVMNSMNVVIGSVGLSAYYGCVSPVYYMLYCNKNYVNYYNYIFQSVVFQNELKGLGNGILEIRMRIPMERLNNVLLPVPTIEEQIKIVNFLDKEITEINNAIKKTKETIEDYRKLKVAIITKVTSKGLNPKCEMKESNIDLIGKIPKHWELKKVKYVVDSIGKGNGITKEEVVANGDTPCIRYGEIYTKYNYFFENCITRTNKDMISSKRYISHGDLLFAGTGELVEEIGKNIAYLGNDECLAGGDIVVIKHHQEPLFLTFALNSAFGQGQKSFGKAKLKVVHISGTEIGNVVIPVPPIEEQKEIGLFLKEKCNEIDNLIENKEKIVEELEQYKKSVIYEYVTGKKEVE